MQTAPSDQQLLNTLGPMTPSRNMSYGPIRNNRKYARNRKNTAGFHMTHKPRESTPMLPARRVNSPRNSHFTQTHMPHIVFHDLVFEGRHSAQSPNPGDGTTSIVDSIIPQFAETNIHNKHPQSPYTPPPSPLLPPTTLRSSRSFSSNSSDISDMLM
jgi:hypothetical protein